MLTADEIATRIENELLRTSYDDADVEPNFHQKLAHTLLARGWKYAESLSRCKVAIHESHMVKKGKYVEIITANFMGRFHQIASHYRVR